jgi:hypothetical protein
LLRNIGVLIDQRFDLERPVDELLLRKLIVVSPAPSSAMWTASRLADSVVLAFSLTRCSLPGGSKKLSPARYTLAGPVAEFCERIAPDST